MFTKIQYILNQTKKITGFFLGFTYYQQTNDQASIQNKNGLLFMLLMQICLTYLFGVASVSKRLNWSWSYKSYFLTDAKIFNFKAVSRFMEHHLSRHKESSLLGIDLLSSQNFVRTTSKHTFPFDYHHNRLLASKHSL